MFERIGEVTRYLSSYAGIPLPAPEGSGEGMLAWLRGLASAIRMRAEIIPSLGEVGLLRLLLEARGGKWDESCHLDNSAVTIEGLNRLARAIDGRINLMQSIWMRLRRERPLPLGHSAFLREIYYSGIVPNPLQTISDEEVLRAIVRVVDPDADPGDEQYANERSEPTEFLYSEILALTDKAQDEEEPEPLSEDEDDDDTEEIDAMPVESEVTSYPIETLRNWVRRESLNLDPPWQRTDLWTPKKKKELVKSLLLGIPLPSIILHRVEDQLSIIDGKQRLSAIMAFMDNKLKLPNYDVELGHELFKYKGCWFDKKGKKSLDKGGKLKIEMTQIPVLIFKNVEERRLRRIFRLYNVNATRLNSAEIRNAVYQNNKIHQAAFILAGERQFEALPDLEAGDYEAQKRLTHRLRNEVLPSTKRYAALDFICRYLGYSRAVNPRAGAPPRDRSFKPISTTAIVNRFFDYQSKNESPSGFAREIIRVFEAADRLFNIDSERLPFHRRDEKSRMRFSALVAITNMVATRLLLDCLEENAFSSEVQNAIEKVTGRVVYPDNQQSATIWDYQAKVVLGIVEELRLNEETMAGGKYAVFLQNMRSVDLHG